MLREGAAKPLAEYIDDTANVRKTLKTMRDCYCTELDTENTLAAALEAEENGEVPVLLLSCYTTPASAQVSPSLPRYSSVAWGTHQ